MTLPEICIQQLIQPSEWWIEDSSSVAQKGSLIFAFSPHIDQIPYTLEPIGRSDPTEHDQAEARISPLRMNAYAKRTNLPVAGMPKHENEVYAAYRAKMRPCLVLSDSFEVVDRKIMVGKPKHYTAPTLLVAPFYGAQIRLGKRSGFSEEFISRIQRLEYPQYHWDYLPHKSGEESILRLDHTQPIGAHHAAYNMAGFKLSDDALNIVDDLLIWLFNGGFPEDSIVLDYKKMCEL